MSRRYEKTGCLFDDRFVRPGLVWTVAGLAIAALFAVLIATGPDAPRCAGIANNQARLACFDAAALPQPAKGAAIPRN